MSFSYKKIQAPLLIPSSHVYLSLLSSLSHFFIQKAQPQIYKQGTYLKPHALLQGTTTASLTGKGPTTILHQRRASFFGEQQLPRHCLQLHEWHAMVCTIHTCNCCSLKLPTITTSTFTDIKFCAASFVRQLLSFESYHDFLHGL